MIGYSPLQSGLLTDAFNEDRPGVMSADDWRKGNAEFQSPRLARNLGLRDALRPVAARYHANVAAVAVAWVLTWSGVSGAIVGARSPEQVDGWIDAARLTLTGQDLDEISSALIRTRAGQGPVGPERHA